jgi:hypothetical protein
MRSCEESAGIAPEGKGGLVGTGTGFQKLKTSDAVFYAPLHKGAVSGMSAKGRKIRTGEFTAVEDNKRMHMPVGAVVVVNGSDKLNGFPVTLLEFEHGGAGEGSEVKVFVGVLAPGIGA